MFGAGAGDDQYFGARGVFDPVCVSGMAGCAGGRDTDLTWSLMFSQASDSGSRDVVEDEVGRRGVVTRAQDGVDLGAEEKGDGGVWEMVNCEVGARIGEGRVTRCLTATTVGVCAAGTGEIGRGKRVAEVYMVEEPKARAMFGDGQEMEGWRSGGEIVAAG